MVKDSSGGIEGQREWETANSSALFSMSVCGFSAEDCDKTPKRPYCLNLFLLHLFLINKLCRYSICCTIAYMCHPGTNIPICCSSVSSLILTFFTSLQTFLSLPALFVLTFILHFPRVDWANLLSRFLFYNLKSLKHYWGIYFLHLQTSRTTFFFWIQSFQLSSFIFLFPPFLTPDDLGFLPPEYTARHCGKNKKKVGWWWE